MDFVDVFEVWNLLNTTVFFALQLHSLFDQDFSLFCDSSAQQKSHSLLF